MTFDYHPSSNLDWAAGLFDGASGTPGCRSLEAMLGISELPRPSDQNATAYHTLQQYQKRSLSTPPRNSAFCDELGGQQRQQLGATEQPMCDAPAHSSVQVATACEQRPGNAAQPPLRSSGSFIAVPEHQLTVTGHHSGPPAPSPFAQPTLQALAEPDAPFPQSSLNAASGQGDQAVPALRHDSSATPSSWTRPESLVAYSPVDGSAAVGRTPLPGSQMTDTDCAQAAKLAGSKADVANATAAGCSHDGSDATVLQHSAVHLLDNASLSKSLQSSGPLAHSAVAPACGSAAKAINGWPSMKQGTAQMSEDKADMSGQLQEAFERDSTPSMQVDGRSYITAVVNHHYRAE